MMNKHLTFKFINNIYVIYSKNTFTCSLIEYFFTVQYIYHCTFADAYIFAHCTCIMFMDILQRDIHCHCNLFKIQQNCSTDH